MPYRMHMRPGDFITFRARVVQVTDDEKILIETPQGNVSVPLSSVVGTDREIRVDSLVTSTDPQRQGVVGIVKAIDGCDAFVRWPEHPTVEDIGTLRLAQVKPM